MPEPFATATLADPLPAAGVPLPRLRGPGGRPLRIAHLTTVGMSLKLLLGTELAAVASTGAEVFGLSAPDEWSSHIAELGVQPVALPSLTRSWDPRRDAVAAGEIAAALRRLRPDVLHTHNPKTGVLGRIIGRSVGVPVVVHTCHGLWISDSSSPVTRRLVLATEAIAARFSHAELYQNAADRAALQAVVPARRSRVVGNGVDLARFRPDPQARARLRAELGVGEDTVLVGGVGRLVREKGIAEYAAVASALAGRAGFVWVGPDDPDKPDALRDLPDGVRFLGERQDMPAFYAALDIFVLPSYREGFSRSAMEASACGVPAVLSDIRGCREIGTSGREVLLVPAGDVDALTAAVATLIDDERCRQAMGLAARRRALGCFDQLEIAQTSLRTYAAVARRRGLGWEVAG